MTPNTQPLWTAPDLLAAVQGIAAGRALGDATGVSIDTRSLMPGDAFVGLRGPARDGGEFVAAALAKGAAVAIVEGPKPGLPPEAPVIAVEDSLQALRAMASAARDRSHARVAAVTGSVGKTTTKEMLALGLAAVAPTHASQGSLNNHWGVPLSLARLPPGAAYAVFELGMNHPGEIGPLSTLTRPDVALITNIEPVHLEFFDDLDGIADAKSEIFTGLVPGGTAVLNADNRYVARLGDAARRQGAGTVLRFGRAPDAEIRLTAFDTDSEGSRVDALIAGRPIRYRLGQPGSHFVINSLAVLAAASALGADVEQVAAGLANFEAVVGRGRRLSLRLPEGRATLLDESYNASPASVRAALEVLGATTPEPGGRRIVALGDMLELGATGGALHEALAPAVLGAGAALVFTCGSLMRQLHEVLRPQIDSRWAPDAEALAPLIGAALRPNDVLMVKGSLGSRMGGIVRALLGSSAAG